MVYYQWSIVDGHMASMMDSVLLSWHPSTQAEPIHPILSHRTSCGILCKKHNYNINSRKELREDNWSCFFTNNAPKLVLIVDMFQSGFECFSNSEIIVFQCMSTTLMTNIPDGYFAHLTYMKFNIPDDLTFLTHIIYVSFSMQCEKN